MKKIIACRWVQAIMLFALASAGGVCVAQEIDPPKKDDVPGKKKAASKANDGARIVGNLTAKSPQDPLRKGCYSQLHEHKMAPGKTFIITMADQNEKTMDPYLRLEDSTGKILAENDDIVAGIQRDARIVFTPAKEDTYRIIATTFEPGSVGKYLLTIQAAAIGSVAGLGNPGQFIIPVDFGDISITALPTWGHNSGNTGSGDPDTHGYVEYRFIVENNSETDHKVTLTIPRFHDYYRGGHYLSALRRTVDVQAGATRHVSIFQPDLALGGSNVEVSIDGRVRSEGVPLSVAPNRGNRTSPGFSGRTPGARPSILVANETLLNELKNNAYKSAVGVEAKPPISGGYSSRGGSYNEPGPYFNRQYTYYEVVRFQAGAIIPDAWSKHWLGYSSFDAVAVSADFWQSAPAEVQSALVNYVEAGGSLLIVGDAKLPASWELCRSDITGFTQYHPGFGHCLVANKLNLKTKRPDVAAWDPDDWRVIFASWETGTTAWQQMRSPTDAHREFPIVEGIGIPVRGLFITMLLFVLIAGPLNVYWLSHSKRRIWLLWTVPVLSLISCVLLVGYMVATEGWHGHVRAQGLTLLDESAQRATTIGWQGYYCPTTPAGGLRFSLDTELTPHLNFGGRYYYSGPRHPHVIEWADEQMLTDGWVSAKIPIHFMTRRAETRRERVMLRKGADGSLAVVNSLGAAIQQLHLAGWDGKIHTAGPIPLGVEAKLTPTEHQAGKSLDKLRQVFTANWIVDAENLLKKPQDALRPGCYLAVLNESPFLEIGLRQTQSNTQRSIVFGIMKDGE